MMDGEELFTVDQGADAGGGDDSALDLSVANQGDDEDQGTTVVKEDQLDLEQIDTEKPAEQRQQQEKEPKELDEFRGMVSGRIRNMIKQAPELGQVFKKYPELQATVERAFRKAVAYSDVFPTVAEARMMRETFPNGQADVQELLNDVKEIETLDNNFDKRDQDGNYPGHVAVIDSFFQRDKEAAVSLMKTLPKEWHRLHPESYNEVMGKIVGATFASRGIPEFVSDMIELAKENEQPDLEKMLTKLSGWVNGYLADKPRPTAEEERLANERKQFDRTRSESNAVEQKRFHTTFVSESKKLQVGMINEHPAIKRLLANTAIDKGKKDSIIEQVRANVERFLARSSSFMRKLRPAYNSRNISEITSLQRAAWSQPWLMNRMVRTVLAKEVPQMVSQNREAVARRTGTQQRQAAPANKTGERRNTAPTGPYKVGGVWYHKDGSRMTTAEVLSGKHANV